jgi:O-acetyl-ADP-ribose deacetylase (regulator of RNase III)
MSEAAAAFDKLDVIVADITRLAVDAIVNAANEALAGGGGVDGAIHRAAGPELLAACKALPSVAPGVRCPTGEARITPGFRLPARWVIHTVGPVWRGGEAREAELLASCYQSALQLAAAHGAGSLAFPAISTGVFGYPIDQACLVAVRTLAAALPALPEVQRVSLVAFDARTASVLRSAFDDVRSSPPRGPVPGI